MDASINKGSRRGGSLDHFQVSFELLKGGMEKNSFVSVEHVLTEVAYSGALDHLFDQSIERWTQSLVIMIVFARYALTPSWFVCSVAKNIREVLKE